MQVERHIWKLLESTPVAALAFCDWKFAIGQWEGFDGFARRFLVPTDELATAVDCAKSCGELCCRKVVKFDDEILAVCPENEKPPIELSRKDIIIYKINIHKLVADLGDILSLEPLGERGSFSSNLLPLGDYIPFTAKRIKASMIFPRSSSELETSILRLSLSGEPQIIATATGRFLNERLKELIAATGSLLLVIDDLIRFNERGQLEAKTDLPMLFEPFVQAEEAQSIITLPPQTRWEDITIEFVDGHTVSVRAGRYHKRLSYSEMGMEDKRTKCPNKQWQLLLKFAQGGGIIRFGSLDRRQRETDLARLGLKMETDIGGFSVKKPLDKTTKSGKKALSKILTNLFGIADDPIEWKGGAYVCRFKLVEL